MPAGIPIQTITAQSLQGKTVSLGLCQSSGYLDLYHCAVQLRYFMLGFCTPIQSGFNWMSFKDNAVFWWCHLLYPSPSFCPSYPSKTLWQNSFETGLGRSVFQGFRVCSLQELLRLSSVQWRLKNPVTQEFMSELHTVLCTHWACKVWSQFCNECQLFCCFEWT